MLSRGRVVMAATDGCVKANAGKPPGGCCCQHKSLSTSAAAVPVTWRIASACKQPQREYKDVRNCKPGPNACCLEFGQIAAVCEKVAPTWPKQRTSRTSHSSKQLWACVLQGNLKEKKVFQHHIWNMIPNSWGGKLHFLSIAQLQKPTEETPRKLPLLFKITRSSSTILLPVLHENSPTPVQNNVSRFWTIQSQSCPQSCLLGPSLKGWREGNLLMWKRSFRLKIYWGYSSGVTEIQKESYRNWEKRGICKKYIFLQIRALSGPYVWHLCLRGCSSNLLTPEPGAVTSERNA